MVVVMRKFAKLFESEKFGQILIVNDTNDDGDPSVRLSTDCSMFDLGICSISISDSDNYDVIDKIFDAIDLDKAETFAKEMHDQIEGMING